MSISEIEDALIELCKEDEGNDPFSGVSMLYPLEVYAAYASIIGLSVETAEEFSDWRTDAEDAYQGEYNSDKAFAENFADGIGAYDSSMEWPYNCIDWEYAARELMYDYSEAWNHYFRNN